MQRLLPAPVLLRGLALGGAALFLLVLADVLAGGALTRLDGWLEKWLAEALAPKTRARLEAVLSVPGDAWVIVLILAAGTMACLWARRPRLAVLLAGSGLASNLLVPALKHWIGRARPSPGADLESLAFPSGHATQSTVAWGLLWLVLLARGSLAPGRSTWVWVVWLAAAGSAGAGRVLGGVHWLSDVLAGWALGAAIVASALMAGEKLEGMRKRRLKEMQILDS